MNKVTRWFLAGIVVPAVLALGAPSAQAFHPTDGTAPFTGASTGAHRFSVRGGAALVTGTASSWNGSTTAGAAAATPIYTGATALIAGTTWPATITTGTWNLNDGGSSSPLLQGIATTAPVTTITITGLSGSLRIPSQTKQGVSALDNGPDVDVRLVLNGLSWTASGNVATFLGAASGTDGGYNTLGQTIHLIGVNAG